MVDILSSLLCFRECEYLCSEGATLPLSWDKWGQFTMDGAETPLFIWPSKNAIRMTASQKIALVIILPSPLFASVLLPPSVAPFLFSFVSSPPPLPLFLSPPSNIHIPDFSLPSSPFGSLSCVFLLANVFCSSKVPAGQRSSQILGTTRMGSPSLSRWHPWILSNEYKTEITERLSFKFEKPLSILRSK